MSKLKDYNIPGWPEKKEISCRCLHNTTCGCNEERYSKMLDIIENLEFNPAELLDVEQIVGVMIRMGHGLPSTKKEQEYRDIAQAIVDSKDVVKPKESK